MLVAADETLLHQVARPLSQTSVTDHRFYDRYWFTGTHPSEEMAFAIGMGLYKNTNVLDGFFVVQKDRRQYNLRLSRVLRPDIGETRVGPLSVRIVEPFKRIRLVVEENDSGLACELDWVTDYAVHLEAFHADAVDGTITQEVTRYDQVATVNGWIAIEGRRYPVANWWSVRDHSWGIRPGVGGFEPIRGDHAKGSNPRTGEQMRLWLWGCFSTAEYSMQMQRIESIAGNVMYMDGQLLYRPALGRENLQLRKFEHDIRFHEGTHAVRSLDYHLELSNGMKLEIKAEPAVRAWAYAGTGYDRGYNDGRGLGAQRGNLAPEYDIYDLSHVQDVRNPAGALIGSGHREQPVRLTVNGERCSGYFPVMVWDTLPGMAS